MHKDCFEKIISRYEELGDANCVHAMYEYAHFLFSLDKWGIAPDYELSLMWFKKAAYLDHAGSLEWLSCIYGDEIVASDYGFPVNTGEPRC